jgi:hypothetical protein
VNKPLGAVLDGVLRGVATATAALARFCDHAEHVEEVDRSWIMDAATRFQAAAVELASALEVDLREVYATRLAQVEAGRYIFSLLDGFDGGKQVTEAVTWQDLQRIQFYHDRYYHPDVVTLSQADHLRHCVLHGAKLAGLLANVTPDDRGRSELTDRGLADLMVFALKLSTLVKVRLPNEPLPLSSSNGQVPHRREVARLA